MTLPPVPRLPTYFISHGGGPWPYMLDELGGVYDPLAAALRQMPQQIGATPTVVLVISGHWEEPDFTVMATPQPQMIYDYSGFPEHTYRVEYNAPGSPATASRVRELLEGAGIAVKTDARRGFDHGTYSPLVVIYPQADVPVLQLSLKAGYDPAQHLAVGRALAPLRDAGVLILGSGLSYHNLRQFGPGAKAASGAFDRWLDQTLVHSSPVERTAQLQAWQTAPAARQAHPREDHLLPLMVAVGAAEGDRATRVYHEDDFRGGVAVSSFMFGGA